MKKIIILLAVVSSMLFASMSVVSKMDGVYSEIAMIKGTNRAVVALNDDDNHHYGVKIVDFSNPQNMTVVGEYNTTKGVRDVAVYGNIAYLAVNDGDKGGLVILNIQNNSAPSLMIQKKLRDDPYYGYGWRVAISHDGTKLAIASGYDLFLYDVTNPSNPTELVKLDSYLKNGTPYVNDLVFSNDDKYLITASYDYDGPSNILDISNPSSITRVGDFMAEANINGIIVNSSTTRLYLATAHAQGLISYKMTKDTSGNFTFVNDFNTTVGLPSGGLAMTQDEAVIYFGSSGQGDSSITAYNVSNDSNETLYTEGWGGAMDVALNDNEKYLLLTQYFGGLYLIDTGREIGSSSSYGLSVKPGWNLLGAVKNLNMSGLSEGIKSVWAYDNNGTWQLHTNSALANATTNNYGYAPLLNISKGRGFWVFNDTGVDVSLDASSVVKNTNGTLVLDANLTNNATYLSANKPSASESIVSYNSSHGAKFAKKDSSGGNVWSEGSIANTQASKWQQTASSPYQSTLYTLFADANAKLSITHSTDSGNTWSTPVVVDDRFAGGRMAINGDKIYVVYHEHASTYGLYLSYSKDGGATWVHKDNIFNGEAGYGADIAIDSMNGDVYISHAVDHAQKRVVVTKIKDGNISTITHTVVDKGSQFSTTSISAYNGKVALVYLDRNTKTLKYAYSSDNGATFTLSNIYNSATLNPYNGYLFPKLAIDSTSGNLDMRVAFIDDNQLKTAYSNKNQTTWTIDTIGNILKPSSTSYMKVDALYDYGTYYLYYVDNKGAIREYIK